MNRGGGSDVEMLEICVDTVETKCMSRNLPNERVYIVSTVKWKQLYNFWRRYKKISEGQGSWNLQLEAFI